jgi:predicted ferric reductase
MKQIKTFLWAFLLGLTVLWWFTDATVLTSLANFFAWRGVLMQYSGVLAIGVMSVAMVLAVRPVLFEPVLSR